MSRRLDTVVLIELETPREDHTVVRLRIAQADRVEGMTGRLRMDFGHPLYGFGIRFAASDSADHPFDVSGGPRMYSDIGYTQKDLDRAARAMRPITRGLAEHDQRHGPTIRLDDTVHRLVRVLGCRLVAGQTRDGDPFADGQTVTFLNHDRLRAYLLDLNRWYCRWPNITDGARLAEFLSSRTEYQIARMRRDGGGHGLVLAGESDFRFQEYATFGGEDCFVLRDGTAAHRNPRTGRWSDLGRVAMREPATDAPAVAGS